MKIKIRWKLISLFLVLATLIQSEYSIVGALLPIATYIPFIVWRIKYKKVKSAEAKK